MVAEEWSPASSPVSHSYGSTDRHEGGHGHPGQIQPLPTISVPTLVLHASVRPVKPDCMLGFIADHEDEVSDAFAAAIEAGGTSESEAAIRAQFGPG